MMVLHACGHRMYRTMDGDYHCPRCQARADTCPACGGDGYKLKGRLMSTCQLCKGTGKTGARMSGHLNEVLTVNSSSGAYASEQDYDSLVAASSWTGPKLDFCTTQTGGRRLHD